MNKEKHIIVVGAGVAGLSTAYYLTKRGIKVTVCEQDNGNDNCSYGNAGLIAPRHVIPLAAPGVISQGLRWMLKKETPFYIKPRLNSDLISWLWKFKKAATEKHVEEVGEILKKMLYRNQNLLLELESEESLNFDFVKKGHLTLCETEKGFKGAIASSKKAKNLGVPVEVMSAQEVLEKEPSISMDFKGGVYYPNDAHIHPGHLMVQLKEILRDKGVEFKMNSKIVDVIEKGEDKVLAVTSEKEVVQGTGIVLCAGAWNPKLTKKLHVNIPIQAGKGYSITLKKPKVRPQLNMLLAEKKVAVTPMGEDLRFAGTMEVVGIDKSITTAKVNAIKKAIIEYYPDMSIKDLEEEPVWVGLRPCSPDGMPYVGKIEPFKSIFVSAGYSMVGMSLSFASGELISQLIVDGQAKLSHPMTNPNRYN